MPCSRNGGAPGGGRVADLDRRQPHGSHKQRADARRKREIAPMYHLLAQTIGGARKAAGAEGALVQPLDCRTVVGLLGQNGEREVVPGGGPGPPGEGGFTAEPGRYHLYVSTSCPWAHRTLIFRSLKKLKDLISISIVDPFMDEHGWKFSNAPGTIPDTINGKSRLSEIYLLADPRFTGRVTVPVLWDKQRKTIGNNESSGIIRMFNFAFDALTDPRAYVV